MGMKPAIAFIPNKGDVLKAPSIHIVAFFAFYPEFLMDTIEAHGYKTKVKICIKQWEECNIYKVDVFELD